MRIEGNRPLLGQRPRVPVGSSKGLRQKIIQVHRLQEEMRSVFYGSDCQPSLPAGSSMGIQGLFKGNTDQ